MYIFVHHVVQVASSPSVKQKKWQANGSYYIGSDMSSCGNDTVVTGLTKLDEVGEILILYRLKTEVSPLCNRGNFLIVCAG
jgi:hypothetical protein